MTNINSNRIATGKPTLVRGDVRLTCYRVSQDAPNTFVLLGYDDEGQMIIDEQKADYEGKVMVYASPGSQGAQLYVAVYIDTVLGIQLQWRPVLPMGEVVDATTGKPWDPLGTSLVS